MPAGASPNRSTHWPSGTSAITWVSCHAAAPIPAWWWRPARPSRAAAASGPLGRLATSARSGAAPSSRSSGQARAAARADQAEPGSRASSRSAAARTAPLRSSSAVSRNSSSAADSPLAQHCQQFGPVVPGFAGPARLQQVPGRGRVAVAQRGQVADAFGPAAGLPRLRSVRRVRPGRAGHHPLPVGAVRGQPAAPVRRAPRPPRAAARGPGWPRRAVRAAAGRAPGNRPHRPRSAGRPAARRPPRGPGRAARPPAGGSCGASSAAAGSGQADSRPGRPPGPPGHGQQRRRVQHAGRGVVPGQHAGVRRGRAGQAGHRLRAAADPDGGRRDQVVVAHRAHSRTA